MCDIAAHFGRDLVPGDEVRVITNGRLTGINLQVGEKYQVGDYPGWDDNGKWLSGRHFAILYQGKNLHIGYGYFKLASQPLEPPSLRLV